MKVVSINVGLPREVEWRGKIVRTSIFKGPVAGRVRVERLNVEGDRQSDLTVHGGADKAVYAYPAEHYRQSTIRSGVRNYPAWIFRGVHSARTL
jgi:MOSC domain-containing protein YiiM